VGDAFGRGLRVTRVAKEGVVLAGVREAVTLRPGADAAVDTIRHVYDVAVVYRGRGRYAVDATLLAGLDARRGVGADTSSATVLGALAQRIDRLDPEGVAARLGLRAGDCVLDVDGAAGGPADAARAVIATSASRSVVVRFVRRGAVHAVRYGGG
jgi:hypothetical protein